MAGVAAGADGVMVEVHPRPDEALSDGEQSITLDQFADLMTGLRAVHAQVGDLPRRSGPAERRAQGRRGQAMTAVIQPNLAGGPEPDVAGVRPAARLRGQPRPARRQVDQPSGPAPGRRWPTARSEIHAAGDGADVRTTAGLISQLGASVERRAGDGRRVDYLVVSPGIDGLHEAGRDPRLRQLRDDHPADRRDPGRAARLPRPRRRRLVAPTTPRPYHRATASDGCRSPRAPVQHPPADDRGRSHPAPGDRQFYDGVPSAQVKSAILLAALRGGGPDARCAKRSRPAITPSGCSGRAGSRC